MARPTTCRETMRGARLVNDVLVRFDLIDFQRRLHGLGGRRGRESTVPVCVFGCLNAVRQCSSPSPADCVACGCRLGIRHGMGCLPCATLDHIRVSISSLTTLPSIVMKCRVGCCMRRCCGGENAFQGTCSCLASPTNGGNRWLLADQLLRASVLDRCCVSSRLQGDDTFCLDRSPGLCSRRTGELASRNTTAQCILYGLSSSPQAIRALVHTRVGCP
jgi:hypothetical protein